MDLHRNQLRLASVAGGQKETTINQMESQILEITKGAEETSGEITASCAL